MKQTQSDVAINTSLKKEKMKEVLNLKPKGNRPIVKSVRTIYSNVRWNRLGNRMRAKMQNPTSIFNLSNSN